MEILKLREVYFFYAAIFLRSNQLMCTVLHDKPIGLGLYDVISNYFVTMYDVFVCILINQ